MHNVWNVLFNILLLNILCGSVFPVFAVDQRTLNNGNLILEDIPEIPASVVEDLNRYQNVRSAAFQGWSARGDSIYITTRFADVSQLHRVDRAGGARQQLTFFSEPLGEVELNPALPSLAFTMDTGGSEFSQVYLMDLNSGDYRMITDGKSRNGTLLWSHDGKQLAYQSTRRNGAANDIWTAAATVAGEHELAHSLAVEAPDGAWWGPIAFTDQNDRLLVEQYVSATSSFAHIQDLRNGALTVIAGDASRESRNTPVDFNARGDGVFLLTDRYSDFSQLVLLELNSGQETVVTGDIPWDVEQVVISGDKKRGAFATNEDGISRLYLLDTRTLKYAPVRDLPLGIIGNMEFDPSGKRLVLTINTPTSPSDVYVLGLRRAHTAAGRLERWTYSEVGGLNSNAFIEPELVHYPSFDMVDGQPRVIPAFVYKPAGRGPHPVIISIHGGPESQYRPFFSSTFQLWLRKLGAAVIAPNVRGSSGYGKEYVALDNGYRREDSVHDIGALLDWIATQPDLDTQRVAVYGGSYGGYMVLASSVHYSQRLRAAVDVVGISNFVTFLENTQDYRRDLRRVEYGDERDPAMREHLQKISPDNNVDRIKIPMLVIQGQNDPRVPVTESEQIVRSLRGNGNRVWYMNALNEGHGYRKKENSDIAQQAVVMFLREHLLR